MVFFTCNSCNETLKKKDVEKHWMTKCRKCEVLSCVDCGKEFWGSSYAEHIKCISEDAKYSGKDFKAKINKGEVKQELWMQNIRNASTDAKHPRLANLFRKVLEYDNVPRKKAKFENFLKNSVKITDGTLIDQAWEVFSSNKEKVDAVSSDNTKVQSDVESSKTSDDQGIEPVEKTLNESTSANNVTFEERDQSLSERKSKKKRKHKEDDNNEKEATAGKVCELNNVSSEHMDQSHSERKSKKKRKHKEDDNNEKEATAGKVWEPNNVGSEHMDQSHSERKSKKKRKHKEDLYNEKEATAGKVCEPSNVNTEHDDRSHSERKSEKKRKHKHDNDPIPKKATEKDCEDPASRSLIPDESCKDNDATTKDESPKSSKKKKKHKREDEDDVRGNEDAIKENSEEGTTTTMADSLKEPNHTSANDDANVSSRKKHKKKQKRMSSDTAATMNENVEKESNETGKNEVSFVESEITQNADEAAGKKKKKRKHKDDEEALLPKKEKLDRVESANQVVKVNKTEPDGTAAENSDVKSPLKPKAEQNQDLLARLEATPVGDVNSRKRTSKTGNKIEENEINLPKMDEKVGKDGNARKSDENAKSPDTPEKFNWRKTIDRCVTGTDTPEKGVKFKKLKKQILAEYRDQCLSSKSKPDDEILEELGKKLEKYQDKYRVFDGRVKLASIK